MNNSNGLVESFKKIALDCVESSKPTMVAFGSVSSLEPFSVVIEQKFTLTSSQLILCESCRCKDCEGFQELQVGDNLALLRVQGGQKYLVLSKVVIL